MELFVAVVIVWGGCVDALAMHESLDEEDDEEDEDEDDPDVEEESEEVEDDDDEGTVDESESPSSSFLAATGDDPLHTPPCTLFQSLDFFFVVVVAELICGALIGLAFFSSGEYDDDVVVRSVVVGEEVATE